MGANSTVVCGTTIGRYAFVGAGSVVTRDVPDYALVYGNPARVPGWMCACTTQNDFDGEGTQNARVAPRNTANPENRFIQLQYRKKELKRDASDYGADSAFGSAGAA